MPGKQKEELAACSFMSVGLIACTRHRIECTALPSNVMLEKGVLLEEGIALCLQNRKKS
jgi:hypothetical protein